MLKNVVLSSWFWRIDNKRITRFVKHKEKIFGTDLFKINKTYIESIDRTFYYRNFEMERVGMYKSWTSCLKIGIKAEHA